MFAELVDEWVDTWPGRLQPRTQVRYRQLLDYYVLPEFGESAAAMITHHQVQRYLDRLAAGQKRRVKGGIRRPTQPPSASTVRKVHATLSAIFTEGVRSGALRVNPARHCRLPRVPRTKATILTREQLDAVALALPVPFNIACALATATGVRAGELWALQRQDFDLDNGVPRVHIERALKQINGRMEFGPTKSHQVRSIVIPASLAPVLRLWLDTRPAGANTLVFVGPNGAAVRHNLFIQRLWRRAVRDALPRDKWALRFHDLRHNHATLLLAAGAQPLAVKQRLGHASITTTMDTYGHLMPSADADLAALFDARPRVEGPEEDLTAEPSDQAGE